MSRPTKDDKMRRSIDRAFDIVQDMIAHPEKYPDDTVVIAPDHVAEVFTPERARLYLVMQEKGSIASVSELARILGRDVTRVSRDVKYLEGFGLLRLEREGMSKRVSAGKKTVLVA